MNQRSCLTDVKYIMLVGQTNALSKNQTKVALIEIKGHPKVNRASNINCFVF